MVKKDLCGGNWCWEILGNIRKLVTLGALTNTQEYRSLPAAPANLTAKSADKGQLACGFPGSQCNCTLTELCSGQASSLPGRYTIMSQPACSNSAVILSMNAGSLPGDKGSHTLVLHHVITAAQTLLCQL